MTDSFSGSEGTPLGQRYGLIDNYTPRFKNLSPHEDKLQRLLAMQNEMQEALNGRWFVNDDFTAMFLRTALVAIKAAIDMEQDPYSDLEKGKALKQTIIERAINGN